jgi:hypothetical protein
VEYVDEERLEDLGDVHEEYLEAEEEYDETEAYEAAVYTYVGDGTLEWGENVDSRSVN